MCAVVLLHVLVQPACCVGVFKAQQPSISSRSFVINGDGSREEDVHGGETEWAPRGAAPSDEEDVSPSGLATYEKDDLILRATGASTIPPGDASSGDQNFVSSLKDSFVEGGQQEHMVLERKDTVAGADEQDKFGVECKEDKDCYRNMKCVSSKCGLGVSQEYDDQKKCKADTDCPEGTECCKK